MDKALEFVLDQLADLVPQHRAKIAQLKADLANKPQPPVKRK